jgi:hypothetical protein
VSDPIETIRKEWPAVQSAPWSFVILGVILVGGTWFVTGWMNSATISGKDAAISSKDATIESLKQEVESYKDKLSGATPDEAKAKIADLQGTVAIWRRV